MNLRKSVAIPLAVFSSLVLFATLTLLFVPAETVKDLATRAALQQGFTVRTAGFGKAFPIGVKARELELGNGKGPLLKLRDLRATLKILPLFAGRLSFSLKGDVGGGKMTGEITPATGGLRLNCSALPLQELPLVKTLTGSELKGPLMLKAAVSGRGAAAKGTVQLEVVGASLSGAKIGELPLPDATFRRIQGMAAIDRGMIKITSFTLEGDGMYARLRGELPLTTPPGAAPLNLTLELMPKADFLEQQKYVFLLLAKYLSAPGHYQIPVRGTLAKPSV
jgi:type II secretion system protein N